MNAGIERELQEQRDRDKEALKNRRRLYQRVFCTPEGELVLADILNRSGFFSAHLGREKDLILNNFARELLWNIGIWEEWNRFDITRALTRLPKSPPTEKEKQNA